ncbi:RidA family protein [Paenarthrobacter sp. NPDC056912]|uniref:RidA family protein n=1 Tax=Paenarthrobacter sp. NPDC056912 TaxID=3345965 RepID=UPI0036728DBF
MTPFSTAPAIQQMNAVGVVSPVGKYSHITVVNGMAFISGQLPINSEGEPVTAEPFAVQVEQTLANVDACLASAALTREDLVQVRVYVTEIADWKAFDDIYGEWIGAHRPARAVAGVKELHYGAAVEVEAIALLQDITR